MTKNDDFMGVPIVTSILSGKTKRRNNEGRFEGGRDLHKSMWSSFLSADFLQPAMKREADARGGGQGNGLALSITDNLDTLRRYMLFEFFVEINNKLVCLGSALKCYLEEFQTSVLAIVIFFG